MVDSTLVHFKTKENFKREKGNIQDTSIAFIKDSKQISTHDTIYNFVNWNVLDDNIVEVPSKYEFVDLGLPSGTKWASCNVGATSPEESGLFFQWGDTKGYKVTLGELQDESQGLYSIESMEPEMKQFAQDFSDYKFYNSENGSFTKYNDVDGLTTLELSDDAANADYSKMRMPTKEECEELLSGTTSAWTDNYNGTNVKGCVFTSKVDETKSIFVPATGVVRGGFAGYIGLYGNLLSSSLFKPNVEYIHGLNLDSSNGNVVNVGRFVGFAVRGVLIN